MTTGSISRGGGKPVDQMSAGRTARRRRARSATPTPPIPSDKPTALRYASVLQMNGETDQALAVMRKLAIAYPKDREVLAAYGKSLAGAGQFEPALDAVRRAQTPEYPDWKLVSAEGAILDQLGNAKRGARPLSQGARPEAERAVGAFQSRHVLCARRRPARRPKPICARPPSSRAPTAASARTWRWSSACKAASTRPSRSPARNCRPSRRRPTSPISARMLSQQNAWKQLKDSDKKKTKTN